MTMMDNRALILQQVREMHNHICIYDDSDLVRLIGLHEDEQDLYYHVKFLGGKEVYASAVGHIFSLMGKIDQDDYDRIDNRFSLNGVPPVPEVMMSESSGVLYERALRHVGDFC